MSEQSAGYSSDALNTVDRKHSSLDATLTAIRISIEQKGLDVRGLDLKTLTDIADYFVIVSGTSERHVQGIADKIKFGLRDLEERPLSINGYDRGEWILLDYGDVVIHVFYEPTRQYYQFDELWKNADLVPLDPGLEVQARKLRTGVYR